MEDFLTDYVSYQTDESVSVILVTYKSTAWFDPISPVFPTEGELLEGLFDAFNGDDLVGYVGMVQSLPDENTFSSTTSVFPVPNPGGRAPPVLEDAQSVVPLLAIMAACIMVISSGSGLFFYRLRRKQRRQEASLKFIDSVIGDTADAMSSKYSYPVNDEMGEEDHFISGGLGRNTKENAAMKLVVDTERASLLSNPFADCYQDEKIDQLGSTKRNERSESLKDTARLESTDRGDSFRTNPFDEIPTKELDIGFDSDCNSPPQAAISQRGEGIAQVEPRTPSTYDSDSLSRAPPVLVMEASDSDEASSLERKNTDDGSWGEGTTLLQQNVSCSETISSELEQLGRIATDAPQEQSVHFPRRCIVPNDPSARRPVLASIRWDQQEPPAESYSDSQAAQTASSQGSFFSDDWASRSFLSESSKMRSYDEETATSELDSLGFEQGDAT